MALYIGDKKAKLYHGDQHPASLYAGDKLITGYSLKKLNFTAQASVVAPYKAAVGTVVYGVGRQDGTPTPDNLVDPVFLSGAEVGSKGKNLVLFKDEKISRNGIDYVCKNGIITVKGKSTGYFQVYSNPFELGYGVYYISGDTTGAKVCLKTRKNGNTVYNHNTSFTVDSDNIPESSCYLQIFPDAEVDAIVYPQLEIGSTPTPYEPYFDGGTAKIPTLRALPDGSVKDEYDVRTGTLTRRIREVIFDGSENWVQTTWGGESWIFSILENPGERGADKSISTHFEPFYGAFSAMKTGSFQVANKNIGINLSGIVSTLEDLTSWLKNQSNTGKPLKIWYALATPIIEHYDPQILRQHPGTTILTETVPPQKVGKTVSGQVIAVDDVAESGEPVQCEVERINLITSQPLGNEQIKLSKGIKNPVVWFDSMTASGANMTFFYLNENNDVINSNSFRPDEAKKPYRVTSTGDALVYGFQFLNGALKDVMITEEPRQTYTPYIPDLSKVMVSRYGGNLSGFLSKQEIANGSVTPVSGNHSEIICNTTGADAHYFKNFNTITLPSGEYIITVKGLHADGNSRFWVTANGAVVAIAYNNDVINVKLVSLSTVMFRIILYGEYVNEKVVVSFSKKGMPNFSIYVEPQTINPAVDGTVTGMTSLSPNMTILTDNPGAVLKARYTMEVDPIPGEVEAEVYEEVT